MRGDISFTILMISFLTPLMTISSVIPHPHHWDHHHDHHELQVHLLGDPLDLLGDRHNETICRQPHRLYTHTGLLRFLRIRFLGGTQLTCTHFCRWHRLLNTNIKNSTCEKVFAINRRADCANKRSAPLFPNFLSRGCIIAAAGATIAILALK